MGIKICNLCCGHGHVFEGWFRSDEELEVDLKEGRIECPVCGDPVRCQAPERSQLCQSAGDDEDGRCGPTSPPRLGEGPRNAGGRHEGAA